MSAIGLDCYNQSATGEVSMTVRSAAANGAADTVPCVVFNAAKGIRGGQNLIWHQSAGGYESI